MSKSKANNIFLIGPMGAGKSSVGKYLAQQLHMEFFDIDEEIEKRTGVDIGWIFDIEGEEGFHKRETAILNELTQLSGIVLATGGGSVIEDENRDMLKSRGTVVYLQVSLPLQQRRTMNESRRPLLRVQNRNDIIDKLHEEREPIYRNLADIYVETDQRSVRLVTDDIIYWLNKKRSK